MKQNFGSRLSIVFQSFFIEIAPTFIKLRFILLFPVTQYFLGKILKFLVIYVIIKMKTININMCNYNEVI